MLVFVAGWLVMLVAMMLPTTLPLMALFNRMTLARADRRGCSAAAGRLSERVDRVRRVRLRRWRARGGCASRWLADHVWALGGVTLLMAGIYQFTPLKYHCLEKCRSPFSFITQHWRGRDEAGQAFLLGIHHGLFCVGCCWTLMVVMFAVGVGNFGWMLVLGAVMAMEKNLPWGKRLSTPLGVG